MKKKLLNAKGFTLIELMVVMAIIAVLAVLIIGAIQIARRTATETTHRSNGETIRVALEAQYARNQKYPAIGSGTTFDAVVASGGALAGTNLSPTSCSGGGYFSATTTDTSYTIIVQDGTSSCNDMSTISQD